MLWLVPAAAAAPPDVPLPAGFAPIPPVERPAWLTGTVWVRDGDACWPAKVEDAARARLAARVCEEGDLSCDVTLSLDGDLAVVGERCRRGGLRGDAIDVPLAEPPPPLALVRADGEVAEYRAAAVLEAVPVAVAVRAPCTASSLRRAERRARSEVGRDGVADRLAALGIAGGHRTCVRTERFEVVPAPAAVPPPSSAASPDAVDCAVPCPDDPGRAEVDRARSALAGVRFATGTGPWLTVHRTADGCAAAPPTPTPVLPRDPCERHGPVLAPR